MGNVESNFQKRMKVLEYVKLNTDDKTAVTSGDVSRAGIVSPKTVKPTFFDLEGLGLCEVFDQDGITYAKYIPPFSNKEIDILTYGALSSKLATEEEAKVICEKIKKNLVSNFYKGSLPLTYMAHEAPKSDRGILSKNLVQIKEAINQEKKISFMFNGYGVGHKLVAAHESLDILSPYFIVSDHEFYYLLACKDGNTNMSIWRIDLMTDLEVLDDTSTKKSSVENLPKILDSKFHSKHLYMSYDEPILVTLRVSARDEAHFTFLHDAFGNDYRVNSSQKCDDKVVAKIEVWVSEYGIVNWALEHSNQVEILEPESVRNAVKMRVKELTEKYNVQ